jgi:hypothetical protein
MECAINPIFLEFEDVPKFIVGVQLLEQTSDAQESNAHNCAGLRQTPSTVVEDDAQGRQINLELPLLFVK